MTSPRFAVHANAAMRDPWCWRWRKSLRGHNNEIQNYLENGGRNLRTVRTAHRHLQIFSLCQRIKSPAGRRSNESVSL